ncbi:MAG: biopolymer transporter ExbD [Kiritimatiellia bacterium]
MSKSKRNRGEDAKLDMTPMIDVVFQLIIFFVVTLREEDVLAHLDAMSPAPDPNAKQDEKLDLVTIDICNPRTNSNIGILFNKTPVTVQQLDDRIKRAARFSKKSSVLLRCTKDSPHAILIQAMNLCNKYGMTNLAIFSL